MTPGSSREATVMSADLDLGEAHDLGPAEELGDRLLLVLRVGLLQEADLLVEAVEAALDDLGQRRLGLALVAADGLERRPLLLDLIGRHVLLAEVPGTGEGGNERPRAGPLP